MGQGDLRMSPKARNRVLCLLLPGYLMELYDALDLKGVDPHV